MPEQPDGPATEPDLDPGLRDGVRRILGARTGQEMLRSLPAAQRPKTLAEAYRMQHALIAGWGGALAGWKVGATSKEVQALFGIDTPVFGPVFRDTVVASPAGLATDDFPHRLLESEFAFRFHDAVPPRPGGWSRAQVLDAVDAVIPAVEIISPRFERLPVDDIPLLVADFCANGGAVLGQPCLDWRRLDLPRHTVRLWFDDTLCQEGSGALVLGDPLAVLEWFVAALHMQGRGIEAGQFVLTGTMTGLHAPAPGQVAAADFGSLGRVELAFA